MCFPLFYDFTESVTRPLRMSWKFEGGVMCFSPTMEEFRDFSAFVRYMEEQGAQKFGVAKVGWYVLLNREYSHPSYLHVMFT